MAYNSANEKQIETALIEKNGRGEYIKVSRIIKDGKDASVESIDVRLMYTKADTDEILPTQKGIRVSSELYPRLVFEMFRAMSIEEMQEFFDYIIPEDVADFSKEKFTQGKDDFEREEHFNAILDTITNFKMDLEMDDCDDDAENN